MIDTSLKRIIADAGFELNDITRDAVAAERERCAKIAEETAERADGKYDSRTAYFVAEEIRNGI